MDIKEFGIYFSKLREKSGFDSQRKLSIASGVSNGTIARIEAGTQKVTPATLKKLTPFLKNVNYDDLMRAAGYLEKANQMEINSNKQELSQKDEKDIAKRMEQIKKDLASEDGLLFNGEPMSDEAIESFLDAMEYAVRQTQRINKKYIPKKYREKDKQ